MVSGILAYGISFAYLPKEYPMLAEQDRIAGAVISLIIACFGLVGLIVILFGSGFAKHGLKWK